MTPDQAIARAHHISEPQLAFVIQGLLKAAAKSDTSAQALALAALIQICGRTLFVAGSIQAVGADVTDTKGVCSRTHLNHELGDLLYAMGKLCDAGLASREAIHARAVQLGDPLPKTSDGLASAS